MAKLGKKLWLSWLMQWLKLVQSQAEPHLSWLPNCSWAWLKLSLAPWLSQAELSPGNTTWTQDHEGQESQDQSIHNSCIINIHKLSMNLKVKVSFTKTISQKKFWKNGCFPILSSSCRCTPPAVCPPCYILL